MRELTQAYLQSVFDYHPDGYLVWKEDRWSNKVKGKKAGLDRGDGYFVLGLDGKNYLVHRLIFLWHHGWLPDLVDHEDTNPSNCKISNLRAATGTQNNGNSGISRRNKTGFKGVTQHKQSNRFRAQISIGNKSKHIGTYDTKEEAAKAYAKAAIQYFGEFARP